MQGNTYGDRRKAVTFNLQKDLELYQLACQINFSQFVKRHLYEELRKRTTSGKSSLTIKLEEEER